MAHPGYFPQQGYTRPLAPLPGNQPQQTMQDLEQSLAYQAAWIGAQRQPGNAIPRSVLPPFNAFSASGFLSLAPETSTASTQEAEHVGMSELDTEHYQYAEKDSYAEEENPNLEDVWIAVMGVTGAGKSSFIELCTGQSIGIGHDLVSMTYEVEEYKFVYENKYRIHLIDTPGFDDTKRTDTDVLRDISTWLGKSYEEDIRLSGILYLHPINHNRMTGSARRNLLMFKKLIGEKAYGQVVLATTMWEGVKPEDGERREAELANTKEFWGWMKEKGSEIMRHTHKDRDSAMQILRYLIRQKEKVVLEIQTEMVDQKLDLDQTGAGQQINKDIIALQEKHRKELENLAKDRELALSQKDNDAAEAIQEAKEKAEREIREADKARESLRVNMENLRKQQEQRIAELERKYAREMEEWNEKRGEFEAWKSQSDPNDRAHMDEMLERMSSLEKKGKSLVVGSKRIHRKKNGMGKSPKYPQ